jgi:rare lipoprotein A
MTFARAFFAIVFAAPLFVVGCAGDSSDDEPADEDSALTASAISGIRAGATLTTTARVNFRQGPSKQDDVMRILPVGTTVTAIGTAAQNGFVNVKQGGDEGWIFGAYLKATSASSTGSNDSTGGATGTTDGVTPKTGTGQIETCKASFYDEGQRTANGERFDPNALTAAHKTLKFNTIVRVTNKGNGKTVDVRINDRGPFVSGRCIDLSRAAFQQIASTSAGTASVTVEVLR